MNNIAVINACFTEIQTSDNSRYGVDSELDSSLASETIQEAGNQLNANASGTFNQTIGDTQTDINRHGI